MKFGKIFLTSLLLFIFGLAITFAISNFIKTGKNWDAGQNTSSLANDNFILNGSLSITDSRSSSYASGNRGVIYGIITSDLYGIFNIDKNILLKLDVGGNTTPCGQGAIERYKLSGKIISPYWGTMKINNTSYMCDNQYLYLSLNSNSLGKKEIGLKSGSNSNILNAGIFNKQIISVGGILNTTSKLSGNILNRGNGKFNVLDVSISTKTISNKYIAKNIFTLYRNIIPTNKTSLTDFNSPTAILYGEDFFLYDYTGKTKKITFSGSIYKNKGEILEIGNVNNTQIVIKGKKTVIVKGGNIYINSNLYNKNDSSSLLVLVAKRDNLTGNGGNIYIDPSVTNIDAVLITDGSLISYVGGNIQSVGNTNGIKKLRKQLLIFGAAFTSNTIGSNIIPYGADYYKTTGYTNNTMTNNIYDFVNLRTFNLDYGSGSMISGCNDNTKLTPIDTGVMSWAGERNCYLSDLGNPLLRKSSKVNSLIIEYNPAIQILKPYILSTNLGN